MLFRVCIVHFVTHSYIITLLLSHTHRMCPTCVGDKAAEAGDGVCKVEKDCPWDNLEIVNSGGSERSAASVFMTCIIVVFGFMRERERN